MKVHATITVSISSLCLVWGSAIAATTPIQTIGYGEKDGMELTVQSIAGVNTAQATITTSYTRANAIADCQGYNEGDAPIDDPAKLRKCSAELLTKVQKQGTVKTLGVNTTASANCVTGVFVNFWGTRVRFSGLNHDEDNPVRYRFVYPDGSVEGPGAAGKYGSDEELLKTLCPKFGLSEQ